MAGSPEARVVNSLGEEVVYLAAEAVRAFEFESARLMALLAGMVQPHPRAVEIGESDSPVMMREL